MAILTSRSPASGVTLNDLIHIVITSDQSQNPAGSSYKATIGQVFDSLSSYTFTNISISGDLNVSGNTTLNGLTANTISASTIIVDGVNLSGVTPNFIHKYTIFVDPNGDDETGEFGNMHKPFRNLTPALMAAIEFMSGDTATYFSDLYYTAGAEQIAYRYPYRIQIQVFAGLYRFDSSRDGDYGWNLMFNNIDWYFHSGAIVHNYGWNDSFNIINLPPFEFPLNIPTYCNVYGDGTFTSNKFLSNFDIYYYQDKDISVSFSGSVLNMEGESSNLGITVRDGLYKGTFRNIFIFGNKVFFSYFTIFGGEVILKVDIVKWVYRIQNDIDYYSLFYVENGKLDCDFGRYTAIAIPSELPLEQPYDESIYNSFSNKYEPFTSSLYWKWRIFLESKEDPAPYLGYFEEYGDQKSNSIIRIDYGKFFRRVIEVDGGNVQFYPKIIDIYPNLIPSEYLFPKFGSFGGPYNEYNGASKFMIHGGIINFINFSGYGSYSTAIEIYDNPIVYIKDTQFIWDNTYSSKTIDAISYYGNGEVGSYEQTQSFILDGAKFTFKGGNTINKHMFYINNNNDENLPFNIKVYSNVYSNFNTSSLIEPTSDNPVVNLIPGTNIIIDPNVSLI